MTRNEMIMKSLIAANMNPKTAPKIALERFGEKISEKEFQPFVANSPGPKCTFCPGLHGYSLDSAFPAGKGWAS